jgi:hypothetical protein
MEIYDAFCHSAEKDKDKNEMKRGEGQTIEKKKTKR